MEERIVERGEERIAEEKRCTLRSRAQAVRDHAVRGHRRAPRFPVSGRARVEGDIRAQVGEIKRAPSAALLGAAVLRLAPPCSALLCTASLLW